MNKNEIKEMLENIININSDFADEYDPDGMDDRFTMLYNNCIAIAEKLDIKL